MRKSWDFKPLGKEKLVVISTVFNPIKFSTRYNLYKAFEQHVASEGVKLITVEVAFGNRAFEVTEKDNLNHVQLRTDDEIWQKERALNLGLWHLLQIYPDTEYVLFADADISFVYKNWAEKIIQQLQHFDVIQPWSTAVDLGPQDEALKIEKGFMYNFWNKTPERQFTHGYYHCNKMFWGHPGYCWAWRVEALRAVGSLLDHGVAGSADHHMAAGLVGEVDNTYPDKVHENYKTICRQWQQRAVDDLKINVGHLDGSILHYFHGHKVNRKYTGRWSILLENNFDPLKDIYPDEQGIYKLRPTAIGLRDDLRRYFRSRDEDSA